MVRRARRRRVRHVVLDREPPRRARSSPTLIKRHHPRAHVVVGGPHATPLAAEMLAHHPSIDTVCARRERRTRSSSSSSASPAASDHHGHRRHACYRDGERTIVAAPERANIADLDALASPHALLRHAHRDDLARLPLGVHVLRRRDAPGGAAFAATRSTYVLDALESALARLPVKMIQIKDDTFTTNKKRVLELCRGIRERKLQLLLELRHARRRAQRRAAARDAPRRLPAPEPRRRVAARSSILDNIDKKITRRRDPRVDRARQEVRHPGALLHDARQPRRDAGDVPARRSRSSSAPRPHQYIFSCLSIYPGTRDFHDAEKAGWLDREVYFTGDFQELKTPFDASEDDTRCMNDWFAQNNGLRDGLPRRRRRVPRRSSSASATTTPRTWTSARRYYHDGRARRAPSSTCGARSSSAIRCPGLALQLPRVHRRRRAATSTR